MQQAKHYVSIGRSADELFPLVVDETKRQIDWNDVLKRHVNLIIFINPNRAFVLFLNLRIFFERKNTNFVIAYLGQDQNRQPEGRYAYKGEGHKSTLGVIL